MNDGTQDGARGASSQREHYSFYLVQRLKRQRFGGGKGFDAIFALDYMGSSEFEWGAIPKALKSLRSATLTRSVGQATHCGVTRTVHCIGPAQGMDDRLAALNAWLSNARPRGKERSSYPENHLGATDEWHAEVIAWWAIDSDFCWTLDSSVADDLWRAITSTTESGD